MNEAIEMKLQQILDFRRVISMINKELKSKSIYDCEYMLINNSVEDVIHVLEDQSNYYNTIRNAKYDSNITFEGLLKSYFISVKQYYEKLLIKEGKNDSIADKYHRKLVEPVKDKNGNYLIYNKSLNKYTNKIDKENDYEYCIMTYNKDTKYLIILEFKY